MEPNDYTQRDLDHTQTLSAAERRKSLSGDTGRLPPDIHGYSEFVYIDSGAMGDVWAATHNVTRQRVAIKLLPNSRAKNDRVKEKFRREIVTAARIEHPNIGRVSDGDLNQAICFYAMEYVDGLELNDHIRENKLSEREIIQLLITCCRAMQVAHDHGVIHRDLKPGNILVNREGQPKILDFGLAKSLSEPESVELDDAEDIFSKSAMATADVFTSMPGEVIGTPLYMSPEQAKGRITELDGRTDVYSLGTMLYEFITGGNFPFDTKMDVRKLLKRKRSMQPRPPSAFISSINPDLEAIILHAIEPFRNQRYQSADALADDLQRYLDHRPVKARPGSAFSRSAKFVRRNRLPLAIAASVLLATGIGIAFTEQKIREADGNLVNTLTEQLDLKAQSVDQELLAVENTLSELESTMVLQEQQDGMQSHLAEAKLLLGQLDSSLADPEFIGNSEAYRSKAEMLQLKFAGLKAKVDQKAISLKTSAELDQCARLIEGGYAGQSRAQLTSIRSSLDSQVSQHHPNDYQALLVRAIQLDQQTAKLEAAEAMKAQDAQVMSQQEDATVAADILKTMSASQEVQAGDALNATLSQFSQEHLSQAWVAQDPAVIVQEKKLYEAIQRNVLAVCQSQQDPEKRAPRLADLTRFLNEFPLRQRFDAIIPNGMAQLNLAVSEANQTYLLVLRNASGSPVVTSLAESMLPVDAEVAYLLPASAEPVSINVIPSDSSLASTTLSILCHPGAGGTEVIRLSGQMIQVLTPDDSPVRFSISETEQGPFKPLDSSRGAAEFAPGTYFIRFEKSDYQTEQRSVRLETSPYVVSVPELRPKAYVQGLNDIESLIAQNDFAAALQRIKVTEPSIPSHSTLRQRLDALKTQVANNPRYLLGNSLPTANYKITDFLSSIIQRSEPVSASSRFSRLKSLPHFDLPSISSQARGILRPDEQRELARAEAWKRAMQGSRTPSELRGNAISELQRLGGQGLAVEIAILEKGREWSSPPAQLKATGDPLLSRWEAHRAFANDEARCAVVLSELVASRKQGLINQSDVLLALCAAFIRYDSGIDPIRMRAYDLKMKDSLKESKQIYLAHAQLQTILTGIDSKLLIPCLQRLKSYRSIGKEHGDLYSLMTYSLATMDFDQRVKQALRDELQRIGEPSNKDQIDRRDAYLRSVNHWKSAPLAAE